MSKQSGKDATMNERQPDFYLGSTETTPPIEPRKCFILERLRSVWGRDLVRVKLDPPIVKAPFWPNVSDELEEAVLQARFEGQNIDPVSEWPLAVHIAKIIHDKIKGSGFIGRGDVRVEYWGEIYRTVEEAEKWIAPWR